MGGHSEQGHDKVEFLSSSRPAILEGGPDQTVAEFRMLFFEDAEHPSARVDAGVALQVEIPVAKIHERPGTAANVQNIETRHDLERIVNPLASLNVGVRLVNRSR